MAIKKLSKRSGKVNYVEHYSAHGPHPCRKCKYFLPSAKTAWPSACSRVEGPIHSGAHCDLWENANRADSNSTGPAPYAPPQVETVPAPTMTERPVRVHVDVGNADDPLSRLAETIRFSRERM